MKPNIGPFSTPKRIQSDYIIQEVLLISQPSLHVKLTMIGKIYSFRVGFTIFSCSSGSWTRVLCPALITHKTWMRQKT